MRALTIGLALLGVCVFVWGLDYKLSLYEPPHSMAHHMPEAKLLTGKERMTLPVVTRHETAPREALPNLPGFLSLALFAAAGLALPGKGAGRGSPVSVRRTSQPGWVGSLPFCVRPPPVSL